MVEQKLSAATQDEPIIAWRAWRAKDLATTEFHLESLHNSTKWPFYKELKAACTVFFHSYEAPVQNCACGIWGLKSKDALLDQLRATFDSKLPPLRGLNNAIRVCFVIGQVSMWGKVIEGTKGYRAQFAYPYSLIALNADERVAESLRRNYQVDVRVEMTNS